MAEPDYKAMLIELYRLVEEFNDGYDNGSIWIPSEIEDWWKNSPERAASEKAARLEGLRSELESALDWRERAEAEVAEWRRHAAIPHPLVQAHLAEAERKLAQAKAAVTEAEADLAAA